MKSLSLLLFLALSFAFGTDNTELGREGSGRRSRVKVPAPFARQNKSTAESSSREAPTDGKNSPRWALWLTNVSQPARLATVVPYLVFHVDKYQRMQGHSWLCTIWDCVHVRLCNTFPHIYFYIVSSFLRVCERIGNRESKKIEARVPTPRPWLRYTPFPTLFLKPYTLSCFQKNFKKIYWECIN